MLMGKWEAVFVNNPHNDYELIVEITHDDEDVALIRRGKNGLEMKWYVTKSDLIVPLEWILEIIIKAKRDLEK